MLKLFKNENVQFVIALISVMAVAIFVLPLCITLFFKGLLFLMESPIKAILYTSLFLAGMFANEMLTKIDNK